MVLDSKIQHVKEFYGLQTLEDWNKVRPEWVLNLDGIGPVTLNHIRLYLASKGVTLQDDKTPEFWSQHLAEAKMLHQMGDKDVAEVCPFKVVIDSNETLPYDFVGIKDDSGSPLIIDTVKKSLWSMGRQLYEINGSKIEAGLADYSIDGMEDLVQVERKSLADLFSTFGAKRFEFEARVARMNDCRVAYLVIEAEWLEILNSPPRRSKLNPKTIARTHDAWTYRYPNVHWVPCAGRRHAEVKTFRLLEMFWKQEQKEMASLFETLV